MLEALLHDTPIIGQALQSKIDKFLKNKRPGAMTAMKAWATRMRYKFRSIPLRAASKFAVALDINVGRGQLKNMSLQQEGMTPKSIFDRDISFEGSIPCIRWSSASGEQVPLTPPQVANWIYQALIDVTSELNKLLGSADFDKHGHAKGDGKGEVMLWWRSHLGSARDQGLIAWDYDADLAVVHVPGCDVEQVFHSAKTQNIRNVGVSLHATQHGNKETAAGREDSDFTSRFHLRRHRDVRGVTQ